MAIKTRCEYEAWDRRKAEWVRCPRMATYHINREGNTLHLCPQDAELYPNNPREARVYEIYERCPHCGDPIDYCPGHGMISDPLGRQVLVDHEQGEHGRCHPMGCRYALDAHLAAWGEDHTVPCLICSNGR